MTIPTMPGGLLERPACNAVRLSVAAALAILLAACAPIAQPPVVLQVTGYGVIESERVAMRADETSSVGAKRADAGAMRIAASTTRIPLRPGLSYGIAFRVIRAPTQEVSLKAILRTSAPCVLKGTGEIVYHNDTVLTVQVGQLRHLGARIPASAYENHCAGEPQPGIDTFELWFEGWKLAERTFEVNRE